MAGHSHWAGIKHKKEAADKKRAKVFSKLLTAITIAAREESNPEFNPRLRTAIDKAKENQVPKDVIERAVKRASESADELEELLFGGYGPGGAAILIEAVSDSRNRTVQEVKHLLNSNEGKWAEPASVEWAFEKSEEGGWSAKFLQDVPEGETGKLKNLIETLDDHDDVQAVYTNATLS